MKQIKKAYILNLCIVCLEIFSVGWMFSGLRLPGTGDALSSSRFSILKYFTVDSNILMGIVAGIMASNLRKILKGKANALSKRNYVLGLMATVGVTLTMLVTLFYLAPTIENGWVVCFNNSNLFLHIVNPILSIVAFVCYEKTNRLKFKDTLAGPLPMCIYAVFYVIVAVTHSEDGYVLKGYDLYGFFGFGLMSGFIVFPVILIITYAISACLYGLNHIKYSLNENADNEADLLVLIKAQQGELDAVLMYKKIAEKISDPEIKALILETAADEGRHGSVFQKLTGVNLKPKKTKAIFVPKLMAIIGKKRMFKIIASQEYAAEKSYIDVVSKYPVVESVKQDERMHGDRMLAISEKL